MNTLYHCKGSISKWGGTIEDYEPIHSFIDSTKAMMPDIRHRAILHSAFGCFMVEEKFGQYITNAEGRDVPVREIAERHIIEDLGFIPTVEDFLQCIPLRSAAWMGGHIGMLLRDGVAVPRHIEHKYLAYRGRAQQNNYTIIEENMAKLDTLDFPKEATRFKVTRNDGSICFLNPIHVAYIEAELQ